MSLEIDRSQFTGFDEEDEGESFYISESEQTPDKTETGIQVNARKTALDLEFSDPGKLMLLYNTLYDTCSFEIQKKINSYLCHVTKSDIVFIIQSPSKKYDAYINVIGRREIFPEIRLRSYAAIVENPFSAELPIVFKEEDAISEKLMLELNSALNNEFKNLMMVPVIHPISLEVVFLIGIVNFQEEPNCKYVCDGLVNECFRFCLGTVLNAFSYAEEREHHRKCKRMLEALRLILINIDDISRLFDVIRDEICDITNAERASIFFTDEDKFLATRILDYGSSFDINKGVLKQIRIPIGTGIAGTVGKTGKLFNCDDVQQESLYVDVLDKAAGVKTRNVMAFPVMCEFNLIAVVELQNKMFGDYFTSDDENTVTAFSVFLCHAISQGLNHKRFVDAANRNAYRTKLVLPQLKDCDEQEFDNILQCTDDHNFQDLSDFKFLPTIVPNEQTVCICLKIFNEFGISKQFNIKDQKLIRFLVYCKQGYHNVLVHNWCHAFSTFHFIFLLMNNLYLVQNKYLTLLEVFALLIAALCHNLDYKASLSPFQVTTGTVLASLYSSPGSIAQNYHVSQALSLLITEDCSIAEHLDNDEYEIFMSLVSKMILATDIAEFIKNQSLYQEMIDVGYNEKNIIHRQNINSLFMTCADLSDYAKSWEHCKDMAEATFLEFFRQEEWVPSAGMLDLNDLRPEHHMVPDLQIELMTDVCFPAFRFLTDLFPVINNCLQRVIINIEKWKDFKLGDAGEGGENESEEDLVEA